jgi:hypothetical protein
MSTICRARHSCAHGLGRLEQGWTHAGCHCPSALAPVFSKSHATCFPWNTLPLHVYQVRQMILLTVSVH